MQIEEAKRRINCPVLYDGREVILKECILWADDTGKKRQYRYSCNLIDGNSIIRVPLEKVENIEG